MKSEFITIAWIYSANMNILQSFMGCMYPGSIRTESIESMEHDHPECGYQAENIDDNGREVSRGVLQLTDKDLIYFRPSCHPVCWPISFIRRYGLNEKGIIFYFESGRRCASGEAVYGFRLSQGADLVNQLKERIEKSAATDNSDLLNETGTQHHNILSNCRLNRSTSSRQQVEFKNKVPQPQSDLVDRQNKKDASTSTDNQSSAQPEQPKPGDDGLRPLSYAKIDFYTTKALDESARAHAASRSR